MAATRQELLDAMLRECDICTHLFTKVPRDGLDFRFTPEQRSTRELLQYLSFVGTAFTAAAIDGTWDRYTAMEKASKELESSEFPVAMARQKEDLRALFGKVTDEDLETKTFTQPWGETMKLGPAILVLAYASLVAYRMQLFLHAKAAGNAQIGTANCWAGVDMPAQP